MKVYDNWEKNNENNLYSKEAAYDAGYIICIEYEIPNDKYIHAPIRGSIAQEMFTIMAGI